MSTVKVIALEPVNQHKPGDEFDVSEREARDLERKRLVKMAVEPSNKMRAEPQNKSNPSPAAGKGSTVSASPAARASAKKTAKPSASGKTATRPGAASSRSTTRTK